MQKFCFKLSKTEEQFRHNIDVSMTYDRPDEFLFFKNYGKGLSFTRNDEIITGVYLQNSDRPDESSARGASIRARFRGKIIHRDEGDFFIGWIYPDPIGLLVVLATFFSFLVYGEAVFVKAFSTIITIVVLFWYMSLTTKCFNELSFMASGE